MVTGVTSLGLVRDELYATMDQAEQSLEHFIAERQNGVMVANAQGTVLAYSLFNLQERGRLMVAQKMVVTRENEKGLQRFALSTGAGPAGRLLQDVTSAVRLSNGDLLVADRELRSVARFDGTGKFLNNFAVTRVSRLAVGGNDEVAMLDAESRSISVSDRAGKVVVRIPAKGPNYVLESPSDLAFDVFQHLYVLDKTKVLIFSPSGKLVTTFTPDGPTALRSATAMALDAAARLYIYDDSQQRVLVYQ